MKCSNALKLVWRCKRRSITTEQGHWVARSTKSTKNEVTMMNAFIRSLTRRTCTFFYSAAFVIVVATYTIMMVHQYPYHLHEYYWSEQPPRHKNADQQAQHHPQHQGTIQTLPPKAAALSMDDTATTANDTQKSDGLGSDFIVSSPLLVFHMVWTKGAISYGSFQYTPQIALETICYNHRNVSRNHMYGHNYSGIDENRRKSRSSSSPLSPPPPPPSTTTLINLYVMDHVTVDGRLIDGLNSKDDGCTIQLHILDSKNWMSFFDGTPLQQFTRDNQQLLERGPYWYAHFTDLFRLTVLWRHGGFFVDSDLCWTRPVVDAADDDPLQHPTTTFKNSVADSGRHVVNAISSFEPNHPYLVEVMKDLQSKYNPKNYISIIQSVSDVAKSWPNQNCPVSSSALSSSLSSSTAAAEGTSSSSSSSCVTILPRHTYYPLSEYRCRMLFDPATELSNKKVYNNPKGHVYAVHYYSSVNAKLRMHPNSTLYNIYKSNCILCNLPTSEDSLASTNTRKQ